MTKEFKHIGKNHLHPWVWDKAKGKPLFAADLEVPTVVKENTCGEINLNTTTEQPLILKVLRSEYHHAEIISIKTQKAENLKGVVRIFTAADIPGSNLMGIINKDHPVLAFKKVRSKGDAVALVAAIDDKTAQKALNLIEVEYRQLPALLNPLEALKDGAIEIHEGVKNNTLTTRLIKRGNVEEAFKNAHQIIEKTYTTQMIEHCYMEPDSGLGYIDEDDNLAIFASTQNPHYDQKDVAALLNLPEEKVRIIQAVTGGGFGSKLDLNVQGFIGLALFHLRRPVRHVYSREEAFIATGKRHPMWLTIKSAVDKNGKLTAMEANFTADTGAYGSYGIAVVTRAAVHATGPYNIPNVNIKAVGVYTNKQFCGAMRGFGTPQAAFACESQMDLHAQALNICPLEFRHKNALKNGDTVATGQKLEHGVGIIKCIEAIKPHYQEAIKTWVKEKPSSPSRLRGVGLGCMWYGVGNTGAQNPSTAKVEINLKGEITLYTGAADIGQGSTIVFMQIMAEILNTNPHKFKTVVADTKYTTNAGATSASRQTYISGNAIKLATTQLADMLLTRAADSLKTAKTELEFHEGTIRNIKKTAKNVNFESLAKNCHSIGLPLSFTSFFDPDSTPLKAEDGSGNPYGAYAFATQMAMLEVDVLTAEVEVIKIVAAHDVGKAINPANICGQIAGGIAMGQGYALLEEFEPGKTSSLNDYQVITANDGPQIVSILIEETEPSGPFGAKGVGEPALVATAPAIINALNMALGKRIYNLPANLEKVMEVCQESEFFNNYEKLHENYYK